MSSLEETGTEALSAQQLLLRAATALEHAVASGEEAVTPDALQRILAAGIRLYVARVERGAQDPPFPAAAGAPVPTATEVLVAVTDMLAACEIELFELGMWQTWGGVRVASPPSDGVGEGS